MSDLKVFEGGDCVRLELHPWIGMETVNPTVFAAIFRVTSDEASNWLPWVVEHCRADINAHRQQPYQIDDLVLAYDGTEWRGNVIGRPGYDPQFQAELQVCIHDPSTIPRCAGGLMRFSRRLAFEIAASVFRDSGQRRRR